MSNPLPAELLDYVIDHLCDTQDALRNCCLVSKSWVPSHPKAPLRRHQRSPPWGAWNPGRRRSRILRRLPRVMSQGLYPSVAPRGSSQLQMRKWVVGSEAFLPCRALGATWSRVELARCDASAIPSRPIPRTFTRHQIPPLRPIPVLSVPPRFSTSSFHSHSSRTWL
jgi:hypothetical protein